MVLGLFCRAEYAHQWFTTGGCCGRSHSTLDVKISSTRDSLTRSCLLRKLVLLRKIEFGTGTFGDSLFHNTKPDILMMQFWPPYEPSLIQDLTDFLPSIATLCQRVSWTTVVFHNSSFKILDNTTFYFIHESTINKKIVYSDFSCWFWYRCWWENKKSSGVSFLVLERQLSLCPAGYR